MPPWVEERHRDSASNNQSAACNGTIISDTESKGMGEVIQLQGDQRTKIKEFLTDKDNGLGLDDKTIKVRTCLPSSPPSRCLR